MPVHLQHVVLLILSRLVHVLVDRNVLNVIIVLLLTAKCKLCRLIELVSVAFARDVHHDQVFSLIIELSLIWPIAFIVVHYG